MCKCGYANKGCNHASNCQKESSECGYNKYFDWLMENFSGSNMLNQGEYAATAKLKQPIIDRCKGCSRVDQFGFCSTFVIPEKRWPADENDKCFLADHIALGVKKGQKINPLKASRRAAKGG